jgi:sulfite exporter TauE/SafE
LIHINAVRHGAGHQLAMMESLHWLGGLCTTETTFEGGMLLGLFAAGAAGSIVHCGPMCGVFVLGQMSERMARLPPERMCERQRIGNGLLLPYHLGRLTTYAGLGALAAGSAAVFGRLAWVGSLSAVLLTIAALLFLTHAVGRVLPAFGKMDRAPRFWGRLIGIFTRRIARGSVFGEYLFGVTLGFLPCGFLYAAIAAAAASARPEMGAAAMVAFGLGTAPVLMVIGVAGHAAGRRWSRGVTVAAPALMVLNAALLLLLAWQRVT